MRKMMLVVAGLATATAVGGCTRETTRDALRGGGIGAAGGAVAGALIPGVSVVEGAAVGAAGGAAIGAATSEGDRKWRRDNRGREYYIDKHGNRIYR